MIGVNTVTLLSMVVALALGSCPNSKVDYEATTTSDAFFHMSTVFIVEFDIKCGGEPLRDGVLFALVNDKLLPAAIAEETGKYQVSWTSPHEEAKSGTYTVRIYDEDGHAAIRRAQRNNEDTSKIGSLASIDVNHPGASKGPWLSSESLMVIASVLLCYYAITTKSQLLA